MNSVDRLMKDAIRDRVFPGGVVLVAQDNTVCWYEAYGHANLFSKEIMTKETVFDLASLTKPLATTLAVLVLVQQSKLGLQQKIATILHSFNDSEKGRITIQQLLTHTSGLPDYHPYYKRLETVPAENRRTALRDFLLKEPLIAPIGEQTLYSDLGFMILSWIVETVSGKRLDRMVEDDIYSPLKLDRLFFAGQRKPDGTIPFAATEDCPWRGKIMEGAVHDENAYVVGGIEGHAGLFGTATEVYRLLAVLLKIYHNRLKTPIFDRDLLRLFLTKQRGFQRAFGFDTPSDKNSSCGNYFSSNTVGHLGFTGTSFWMDLEWRIIVILLTNRIHPMRTNEGIRTFRPRLHDTVMLSFNKQGSVLVENA